MKLSEIASKIGTVAPAIGTIVGGPLGGAAGGLIGIVAKVLGAKSAAPGDLLKALTPEGLEKIRQFEMQHEAKLREMALKSEGLRYADIASARAREAGIVKATGRKDYNLYALAWSVIVGFFALCVVLMMYPLPEGSSEVVFMLFGALSSGFGMVLTYFFGSSKSSADKTEHMISAAGKGSK